MSGYNPKFKVGDLLYLVNRTLAGASVEAYRVLGFSVERPASTPQEPEQIVVTAVSPSVEGTCLSNSSRQLEYGVTSSLEGTLDPDQAGGLDYRVYYFKERDCLTESELLDRLKDKVVKATPQPKFQLGEAVWESSSSRVLRIRRVRYVAGTETKPAYYEYGVLDSERVSNDFPLPPTEKVIRREVEEKDLSPLPEVSEEVGPKHTVTLSPEDSARIVGKFKELEALLHGLGLDAPDSGTLETPGASS